MWQVYPDEYQTRAFTAPEKPIGGLKMATKIRCKYLDCAFLDEGYCISAQIDLDSDKGCLTYQSNDDLPIDENIDEIENLNDWEENEDEDIEDENDDDDPWMDDEDDEDDYN